MKTHRSIILVMVLLLQAISIAQYAPRQDVIWARTVPAGTITMDGVLNEAAWAQAESFEDKLWDRMVHCLPVDGGLNSRQM